MHVTVKVETVTMQERHSETGGNKRPKEVNINQLKKNSVDNTKPNSESKRRENLKNEKDELAKHRSNIQTILKYTNATPILNKNIMGYACCFCFEQFPEPADLKKHTLEEHEELKLKYLDEKTLRGYVARIDITDLKCLLCDINIDSLEEMVNHLQAPHKKIYFTDIKSRVVPFKFDSDTLRCVYCLNHFSQFKMLQDHMHAHFRNFICPVCDKGYVNAQILMTHSYLHKTGEYPCSVCRKVFGSLVRMKTHLGQRHKFKGKTTICPICGERFASDRTRNAHMVADHGMAPVLLKCQACDESFPHQRALRRHTKRDHLMERKHACTECSKSFFYKTTLQQHMTTHTGVKDFKCDICSKSYSRKNTLREHMRIHNDDRRFSCKYCTLTFVQKCSMKGHMKSKHGVVE